jgi:hypothetical protein
MNKIIWTILSVFLVTLVASAQDTPQAELSAGFSHFHIIKGFTIPMAPTILSYPQLGFSRAIRTTTRSTSSSTRGRPADLRNFDSVELLAMTFRHQARRVSGLAAAATSFSALRPRRWAISAKLAFSASDNSNRLLIWALRIRFSAARRPKSSSEESLRA